MEKKDKSATVKIKIPAAAKRGHRLLTEKSIFLILRFYGCIVKKIRPFLNRRLPGTNLKSLLKLIRCYAVISIRTQEKPTGENHQKCNRHQIKRFMLSLSSSDAFSFDRILDSSDSNVNNFFSNTIYIKTLECRKKSRLNYFSFRPIMNANESATGDGGHVPNE